MNDPISVFGTDGREYVDLMDRNGIESRQMVAYLVAETFIGPRPKNQYVQYKDKNVRNNRADNLYYGPNNEDTRFPERLSEVEIKFMIDNLGRFTVWDYAEMFGVDRKQILKLLEA